MPKSNLVFGFSINSLQGGGAERVILNLCQALHEKGVRVVLIVLESEPVFYDLEGYDFDIHFLKRIPRPFGYLYLLKGLQLTFLLRKLNLKFDCFVSNLLMSDVSSRFLPISNKYCLIHNNISTSISLGGINYKNWLPIVMRRLAYIFFARLAYKGQNLIFLTSDSMKAAGGSYLSPKNKILIPNSFDFERIKELADAYDVSDERYIIHVGRFDRQKNHRILITAFSQAKIPGKLLLLGDCDNGYGNAVKKQVRDLGLENRVVFKSFKSNPFPYIKKAEVLVLSSDFEGLPTVLIEAIALGVKVVSTDCDFGPREIMTGKLAKWLCPVGSVDALSRKIEKAWISREIPDNACIRRFDKQAVVACYLKLAQTKSDY